jgi:hypothetical protein
MLKRFLEWIGLKEKLHNNEAIPPFLKKVKFGGVILEKMLAQKSTEKVIFSPDQFLYTRNMISTRFWLCH